MSGRHHFPPEAFPAGQTDEQQMEATLRPPGNPPWTTYVDPPPPDRAQVSENVLRLISAAPDLMSALFEMLQPFEGLSDQGIEALHGTEQAARVRRARAAMARAMTEEPAP